MDHERAVPDLEQSAPSHDRSVAPGALMRCRGCGRPLAVVSGDRLIIRMRGREYLVATPARIRCECGRVARLS